MKNKEIGNHGENLASNYLKNRGILILKRNYRNKFDEIDIVGKEKNGTIVFFEVKTLIINDFISPEDNLTNLKLKRIRRAAETFLIKNSEIFNEKRGWRIDLISIVLNGDALVRLDHYENL